MKLLVLLAMAALSVCVESNMDFIVKVMADCKTKVGATDDDVLKVSSHAPPENKEQKCMFACLMDAIGMVS